MTQTKNKSIKLNRREIIKGGTLKKRKRRAAEQTKKEQAEKKIEKKNKKEDEFMQSPEGKRMIVNDHVGEKLTKFLRTHTEMDHYNEPQYLHIKGFTKAPFLNGLLVKLEGIDTKRKTAEISFSNRACKEIKNNHRKEYEDFAGQDIVCHTDPYALYNYHRGHHGLSNFPTDKLVIAS